jgi:hypothetical protein
VPVDLISGATRSRGVMCVQVLYWVKVTPNLLTPGRAT